MSKTIITPQEVKHYSRLSYAPSCSFDDIIEVEYKAFKCDPLTAELKEALLNDLKDTSSATDYDPDVIYEVGDLILYNGYYLEALVLNPGEPSCKSDWKMCDKFEDDCYNDLWCNGLARYLSLSAVIYAAPNMNIKVTGNGAVKDRGADFIPADRDEFRDWVVDKKRKSNIAFEMMEDFMKTSTCFESEELQSCGCRKNACKCGRRKVRGWTIR